MMNQPLTREEIIRVVEGKGCAHRVPNAISPWSDVCLFPANREEYLALMEQYPCDIEVIRLQMPSVFEGAPNDPSYRWLPFENPFGPNVSLDAVSAITDMESIDEILATFPDPNSVALIPPAPSVGETYRVAHWWYLLFERFWSLRGMENALCDLLEYPDQVHKLFRKLTDFYKVVITRCKNELQADAIWTSDDIGAQTGPMFSPTVFREFFKPYYKELIDHTHALGMHFWLHTCGNVALFVPDLIDIGLDVIHPIQKYTMDEAEIANRYGDQICIWAGFDVQRIIPYGTADDVRQEVRFMLDTYGRPDGRLIMGAGNNLTPDTPFASLQALMEETFAYSQKEFGKWK